MPRVIPILVCSLLAAVGETGALSPEYLQKFELNGPYFVQLSKRLFVTGGDFGRMVWESSLDDLVVVSVYSVPPAKGSEKKPVFRITVTRPNKSLMDFPGVASKTKLVISRHDAKIDADLAFAIQRTWRTILIKDHVPSGLELGRVDGFSAIFSVLMPDGETIVRYTASPDRTPATDLVGLGVDLSLYCTAPAEEQKSKRGEIMRRLQTLAETYEKP
jgi:hypothetical protein